MQHTRFHDLVPVSELQVLLDALYRATAIPTALIAPDGSILTASGWQDACVQFHRKGPITAARCRESDAYISEHLHEGPFVGYRCKNGLNDYACPIVLEGQHVATLFTGQLLLDSPDDDFFKAQAYECGFDETAYLEAIHRIPIVAQERIPSILGFLAELAKSMATTGMARLREQNATQKALDMAEERFRVAAESLSDVVYEWDLADRIEWFGNVDELLGYAAGEFPRTMGSWGAALHPDDRPGVMAAVQRHLRGEAPYVVEYRVKRKDGSFSRWAARGRVVRDANDKPLRWIGSITDVTDTRRRVEELRASESRLRTTLSSIGDGVISTDACGRVDLLNPVAEALTGWTAAAAKGRPTAEVFRIVNEETRATVGSPVDRVLRDGAVVGLANHTMLIAKDGTERPIADSGAPIRTDKGDITGVVLVFRDQTEERRAQREIWQAEERFRTFFDNAPIGKCMTAPDGTLVRVNAAFGAMLGYSIEEMQTISFASITHPEDLAESRECVRALLANERDTWVMEKRYLAKDGHHVWTQVTTRLQRDEKQQPLHFLTHILDITDRKRVEQQISRLNSELEAKVVERTSALKDEMELVQKIVSSSPVGVFACHADGPCVMANPAVARISGAHVEKMLQLNFHELAEWKKNGLYDKAQAALATGMDQHSEVHLTTSFGRDVWLSYKFTTFARGGAPHFLMMVDDITERKRMEVALRESEELSRTTLYSIGDGVIATDATGRVVRMNSVAEVLTGWCEAEASGEPLTQVFQIIHEETRAALESPVEHALREGKVVGLAKHTLLIARDGTERPIADSGAPILNEKGEITGVVLVFRDQTEECAVQKALHVHAEQLRESNKELEAFSYSVSHDLRAPLRAIDGFARILSDDYAPKLDDEAKRVCAIIRENTSKMGRLIDDLLTFSRIGRTEMQESEIDMGGMARAVYHEVTTPEHRARIDFQLEMMPTVVGDPSLMRQVWINLLGNAVKFSSKRERVVITVSGETKDGEKVFSVRDNGAGFDMQYVGKLFGVFQRLHSAREFEGTGVGLALVQRVIRRHGGRVCAEGEPDRGATFYFVLPQKRT